MRDIIQLLTRLVAAQSRRQKVGIGHAHRAISARVRDFINLDPPVFTGADPNEDPQVFIDRMQRTLRVMKATTTETAELASYRVQEIPVNWYESWELSRGEDALLAVWNEFTEVFLCQYLPPELRRARVNRFLALRQGKANVVADALSRRSMGSLSYIQPEKRGITSEIYQLASLGVRLQDSGDTGVTIQDTTTSILVTEVKERQYEDTVLAHYRDTTPQKEKTPFEITREGVLRYRGRLFIPNVAGLRR
ncbi:uncharacterized protein [Nicotiana tomentosiformis]|uniref:uncharacterized protein n=1 Tax=Nicotiana tomentosiformis TaxID=4098 RepID=UPI00388CD38E